MLQWVIPYLLLLNSLADPPRGAVFQCKITAEIADDEDAKGSFGSASGKIMIMCVLLQYLTLVVPNR